MGRLFADETEVVRAAHNAAPEVVLPKAVGHDARCHRVAPAGHPLGEHAALSGRLAHGIIVRHVGGGTIKNSRERRANLLPLQRGQAAPEDPHLAPGILGHRHRVLGLELELG